MDAQPDEMALRVGDDVAFAAFDPLTGIKATRTAGFVVFTDWLSITPADGLASRPPSCGIRQQEWD
jgi:hypothetical protein